MTKTEKLEHLNEAAEWLEKALPHLAPEAVSPEKLPFLRLPEDGSVHTEVVRYLYNAIRRIGAVVEELVKETRNE